MRWLFRIAFSVCLLGIIALTTVLYLPALRGNAERLYSDWQELADKKTPATTAAEKPTASEQPTAQPERIAATLNSAPSTTDDPLLIEARRLAQEDPEAAMNWLQDQTSGPQRLLGMLEVVALWAAKDSENALLWLESNAQGIARIETFNTGVERWAQRDPVAAAEWIDGMANDGSKIAAVKALARNWVNASPDAAVAWVGTLPAGALRGEASTALIESWSTTDPEKATIWALSEAEFNGNVDLLDLSIQRYVQNQPAEAEQFMRSLTEAYDTPETIQTYVQARAENNPADAMSWQSQLSVDDPLYQTENTRIIMQEWSRTDSVSASNWLNSQPAGPERDGAILGFNETMLDYAPEVAVAWVNTLTDPINRAAQLTQSIQSWAITNPVEALNWVNHAELDDELRTALAAEISAN